MWGLKVGSECCSRLLFVIRTQKGALREGVLEERASWKPLQSKEDEGLGRGAQQLPLCRAEGSWPGS